MRVSKACISNISQNNDFQRQNGVACQMLSLEYLLFSAAPEESLLSSQALIVDKTSLDCSCHFGLDVGVSGKLLSSPSFVRCVDSR
ncbi:hypothetical protein NPIL_408681 [Nephila pilipes]|uniref:Uncharacterized protein n=1 Tax=Nephila pilipes TaxID=299642 RepID=A0A8X6N044_NEPPI|nr:hypothetical protein NPIL_408681 [Nephila pilipes]